MVASSKNSSSLESTNMRNRHPLPLSTIKELMKLKESNWDNLWVANPLANIIRDIAGYDYQDAIKKLGYLQEQNPDLLDYAKHIKLIQAAQERYNAI